MTVKKLLPALLIIVVACSGDKKNKEQAAPPRIVQVPAFNADSAYYFIEKQVGYGPRIPNTKSHQQTGDYLIEILKGYGGRVTVQEFQAESIDGQKLLLRNIMANFFPEKQKRILLAAHWDTRPYADKDKEKPNAMFDGANDGASGVGVLLEIARTLKNHPAPETGIDIIFFDGEDWGEAVDTVEPPEPPADFESWWCLGSQYWSKHKGNYAAYYGILLDMVGAKNAQFHREGYSLQFAPSIVEKVWNTGARLGYSHLFIKQNQPEITDDHLFVNTVGKIPMIDIVQYQPGVGYFGDYHHTRKDNLQLINRSTLKAVGETVLNVVYYE